MIPWKRMRSVFLDMDGTLLDLNFDNHFWLEFVPMRYAAHYRLSLAAAKAELAPRFRAMEGRLEWYCLDYWSDALRLDIPAMKTEIAGLIAVLPHVTEFLEAVRSTGTRLVLVTNAHPKSLGLKLEKTALNVFFDAIISSHAIGLPKEDPMFWQSLQETEPYEPATTLLVDDSLPVLRAARRSGPEHLVAVRKADSKRAPVAIDEFPAIVDFRELMPTE
ncbi:MAG: GMP/IMP nucleotidase [Methylococcus sp.]|nr:GMP/IMP nucleotidase [Methylococcus sp.]